MQISLDSLCTLGIAALLAGLSATAFSNTDAGDPSKGWASGSYQRGYEGRFETSVPAHESAVALWSAAKWVFFREPANGAVAGHGGWLFTAEEFTEPDSPRNLATELTQVTDALAADGITLVPVIIPDKVRMYAHRLKRGRSEGFETRYDVALATIREAGLIEIDLREVFRFESSFMRTDTHWSPEGTQRAAATIAKSLGDITLPEAQVTTIPKGAAPFDGDLLPFVATGRYRDRVGPAAELINTFETAVTSSGGLFGAADIPVALIGTSYSAKAEFHFEGFLKHALQANVLNLSRVGQGPFRPMDAFLEERSTLSSLPSIVVWEIPERFLTSQRQLP
jgi:alginate O-acetyltransferase complex protein AlgJ